MNSQQIFNFDVQAYDDARPEYPNELINDILSYSGVKEGCRILEIGIGTGQATRPFLDTGSSLVAIDIGDKLIDYVTQKYCFYENFQAVCGDFLDFDFSNRQFDLIFCATAFHWLSLDSAYKKIMKLLNPNGTVALFWNHPFPNRVLDPSNLVSQMVYKELRPESKAAPEFSEQQCLRRYSELKQYGFFDVCFKLYHRTRTLTSDEYISLIRTYSDHRKLPQDKQKQFEIVMKKELDQIGGKINIYDTLDLYLGRKGGI